MYNEETDVDSLDEQFGEEGEINDNEIYPGDQLENEEDDEFEKDHN